MKSTYAERQDKGAVFITGASSGIGYATALLLDRSGYRVFAAVRKEHDHEKLLKEGSVRLSPIFLDITDQDQIRAAVEQVQESMEYEKRFEALINNAGTCEPGPIEFIGIDRLRRQIETNIVGQVAVIQEFLPLIRKWHGRIINVVSASGKFAMPLLGAYSGSKFAMEGISDSLRRELRWWGIPVSIIEPGTVATAMYDNLIDQSERLSVRNSETSVDRYEKLARSEDKEHIYDDFGAAVKMLMLQGLSVAIRPEALAEVIKKALEAKHPKARYRCGPGSTMAVIGSCLPDFITDWFIEKVVRDQLSKKIMGW